MALIRRRLLACTALACAAVTAAPVVASAATPPEPTAVSGRWRTECMLDGFVIGHLPGGLGALRTDFTYRWEEVTFHSRVWETGPDNDGGYRVDLTIKTLRSPTLTDLETVRAILAEYLEQDPAQWPVRPVRVGRYNGYRTDDQLFWFVSEGVAAAVTIDRGRFAEADLLSTARGFQPAD